MTVPFGFYRRPGIGPLVRLLLALDLLFVLLIDEVLIQVEVEALDPNDLRALIDEALDPYGDRDVFADVVAREARERGEL